MKDADPVALEAGQRGLRLSVSIDHRDRGGTVPPATSNSSTRFATAGPQVD